MESSKAFSDNEIIVYGSWKILQGTHKTFQTGSTNCRFTARYIYQ